MRDEFSGEEVENLEEELTNKDRFNNVLSYVPFLNIFLLFNQKQSTKDEDQKYSRQGIALFLLYIVAFVVCSILSFKLSFIITILYVLIALFCATKAYNGMYVEIEFLEKIIAQFQPAKIKKENKTNKEESDIHDPLK